MSSSAGTFSDGVLSRVDIGRSSRHRALRRGSRDRPRHHVTGRGRAAVPGAGSVGRESRARRAGEVRIFNVYLGAENIRDLITHCTELCRQERNEDTRVFNENSYSKTREVGFCQPAKGESRKLTSTRVLLILLCLYRCYLLIPVVYNSRVTRLLLCLCRC